MRPSKPLASGATSSAQGVEQWCCLSVVSCRGDWAGESQGLPGLSGGDLGPGADRRTGQHPAVAGRASRDGRCHFLPGYTFAMKTAISVPDETFQRVERRAAELGVSRSQFYSTAAARYLEDLERMSLTAKINDALARAGDDPDESLVTSYSRRRLAADVDW